MWMIQHAATICCMTAVLTTCCRRAVRHCHIAASIQCNTIGRRDEIGHGLVSTRGVVTYRKKRNEKKSLRPWASCREPLQPEAA